MWTQLPGEGPFFSMSIWNGSTVTYSDWGLRQVATYNVDSGSSRVLVKDLTRPAGVVVSHPDNVLGGYNNISQLFVFITIYCTMMAIITVSISTDHRPNG